MGSDSIDLCGALQASAPYVTFLCLHKAQQQLSQRAFTTTTEAHQHRTFIRFDSDA